MSGFVHTLFKDKEIFVPALICEDTAKVVKLIEYLSRRLIEQLLEINDPDELKSWKQLLGAFTKSILISVGN